MKIPSIQISIITLLSLMVIILLYKIYIDMPSYVRRYCLEDRGILIDAKKNPNHIGWIEIDKLAFKRFGIVLDNTRMSCEEYAMNLKNYQTSIGNVIKGNIGSKQLSINSNGYSAAVAEWNEKGELQFIGFAPYEKMVISIDDKVITLPKSIFEIAKLLNVKDGSIKYQDNSNEKVITGKLLVYKAEIEK